MQTETIIGASQPVHHYAFDGHTPGVSWGAVFAGAAAAAALSFILLILGIGLGLSSVSPYNYSSTAIGWPTIGWVIFMQFASAGIGGYMAGRLRTKWTSVHGDEVHFRDTAHGLLAWAVATLITVAVLAGGVRAVLGGAIDAGNVAATAAAPAAAAAGRNAVRSPTDYFADQMLRAAGADAAPDAQRAEVGRLLATDLAAGNLNADDRAYLGQLLAKRSGMTQADAEKRVDDIYARASAAAADAKAKAMAAADEARKAAAHTALWMFVALLAGAFVASLCATIGGRQRDDARVLLRSPN
jgi:hypothetical protein